MVKRDGLNEKRTVEQNKKTGYFCISRSRSIHYQNPTQNACGKRNHGHEIILSVGLDFGFNFVHLANLRHSRMDFAVISI